MKAINDDDDDDVVKRKLESVNLKPVKNPMGKIVRKDYLSTAAVERRDVKLRDPPGVRRFIATTTQRRTA